MEQMAIDVTFMKVVVESASFKVLIESAVDVAPHVYVPPLNRLKDKSHPAFDLFKVSTRHRVRLTAGRIVELDGLNCEDLWLFMQAKPVPIFHSLFFSSQA
jgi:hypothetical protein